MDKRQAATPVPFEHDVREFCQLIMFYVKLSAGVIIICGTEEKEVVAQHIFFEILFHLVLDTLLEIHFGYTSKASMLLNFIRNVIYNVNTAILHVIAGKDACTWLWHLISILALGFAYDCCKNPIWVTMITTFKITQSFILSYYFGRRSLYEAFCFTYFLATVAIAFNIILYSLRMNQIGLKKVNNHVMYQYEILNSILSSISDSVIRVNSNFVIEYFKDCALHEFDTDDCVGKSLWDVLKEKEQRKIIEQHLRTVFSTGKPTSWKFFSKQLQKHFSARAAAITTKSKIEAVTLLITDITETMIAQAQKEEAKKMDIKLKAKTEFISQISHELKNPLQAINYSIELLSTTQLNQTQKELVESIQESQQLLASILGNVLDLSQIESGILKLQETSMSILSVIETVGDVFYSMAVKKGLQLITFCDPNLPTQCIGDPTRISQILSNFVSNAIKFTSRGYVMLSAHLEAQKKDTIAVKFCCKDTGIGISKENQEKIFKQFVQLPEESHEYHSGWGLGLSISKNLADLLKGRIELESEPGKGCKFTFHVVLKLRADSKSIASQLPPATKKNVFLSVSTPEQKQVLINYLKVLRVRRIVDSTQLRPFVIITDSLETTDWRRAEKVLVIKPLHESQSEKQYPSHITFLKQPVKLHTLVQFLDSTKASVEDTRQLKNSLSVFDNVSVLVVEDNPVVQGLIKKGLSTFGITRVDVASNGIEAIEKIKNSNTSFSKF